MYFNAIVFSQYEYWIFVLISYFYNTKIKELFIEFINFTRYSAYDSINIKTIYTNQMALVKIYIHLQIFFL